MSEEIDLSPYIFDPDNPRACKTYRRLITVLKKKPIGFLDYGFLAYYFRDSIITKSFKSEIWDFEGDFDALPVFKKLEVYKKNYSKEDLFDKVKPIFSKYNLARFDRLFSSYYNLGTFPAKKNTFFFAKSSSLDPEKLLTVELGGGKIDELARSGQGNSSNHVFFLGGSSASSKLLNSFNNKQKASVIVTGVLFNPEERERLKDLNFEFLLLDKEAHWTHLLEAIEHDLPRERSKDFTKNTPITSIDSFYTKDYFSLSDIKIGGLKDQKEVYFLGENGDGKTLILQAIALALSGNQNDGAIIEFLKGDPEAKPKLQAKTQDGKMYEFFHNVEKQKTEYIHLFAYGVNRRASRRDDFQLDEKGYITLFSEYHYLNNPVAWLRQLHYKMLNGDLEGVSFEAAKEMLINILDGNVDEIEVSPDKVSFWERGTEVKFEQLSDGYKNVITWVADLLARLSEKQPWVSRLEDFEGIVLVDEIGMLLHPIWQYKIVSKLREWFPQIQFFFTTHSPSVILGASEDAVFYKVYKEDGKTQISDPIEDLSGYMANSLLTSPLFGLPTAKTKGWSQDDRDKLSSDDYLSQKIHEVISKRLESEAYIEDAEVLALIEEELTKLEKRQEGNDSGS